MSLTFQHKVDYEVGTNENNHNANDSQLDNDNLFRKLDKKKSTKNMMNERKIFIWLIKKMNLKWENINWNKHR